LQRPRHRYRRSVPARHATADHQTARPDRRGGGCRFPLASAARYAALASSRRCINDAIAVYASRPLSPAATQQVVLLSGEAGIGKSATHSGTAGSHRYRTACRRSNECCVSGAALLVS
jgi:hypothetical protein